MPFKVACQANVRDRAYPSRMTRPAPLLRLGAALSAAILLSLAAAPAAMGMVDALGRDCDMEHTAERHAPCPMSEMPSGEGSSAACCVLVPAALHEAAVVPAPPTALRAIVAVLWTAMPTRPRRAATSPPRDTGPPPGPRRHLALSVLLV